MADTPKPDSLRPVAFMVMPFRKRKVESPPPGAPPEVDCDALWDKAYRPALEEIGYLPIRADSEVGSVIVKDMLERLALADLVLADMTLPNGNVYYEVGMRHVAKETHCVLIAADWSRALFDVDQMRSDRFPLKDGNVPDAEAKAIKKILVDIIPKKQNSKTPYYEFVKGKEDSTVFKDHVQKISDFQARVRTVRLAKDKEKSKTKTHTVVKEFGEAAKQLPEVAFELMDLVRDVLGWEELEAYVKTLPKALQDRPQTQEQLLLAKSKTGDPETAIAGLEELIENYGATAERHGLIGGRYKKMWRTERKARLESGNEEPEFIELGHLDSAIEHYTIGMNLDLNEYYCACNLPDLLRARAKDGDLEEAEFLDKHVVRACERTIAAGKDDGWAKPTLLCAAFRAWDVKRVNQLALEVVKQGPAAWHLKTMLNDIDDIVAACSDEIMKAKLSKVRDQLRKLA